MHCFLIIFKFVCEMFERRQSSKKTCHQQDISMNYLHTSPNQANMVSQGHNLEQVQHTLAGDCVSDSQSNVISGMD